MQLPWGAWRWLCIELCWYSKSPGSSTWHNVVAVAMVNKPQSLPTSWIWVFIQWMICLQEISNSLLRKHISTTAGYSFALTYLKNAWYCPPLSLRCSDEGKRCVTPPFLPIVRCQYRTRVPFAGRNTYHWCFCKGKLLTLVIIVRGTDITIIVNMFGGTHFSGKHISL